MIYSYIKYVNSEKLDGEIRAALPSGFQGVNQKGAGAFDVLFSATLSVPDKNTLDALVSAHSPVYTKAVVESTVQASVSFGQNLIKDWGVRVGITGKTPEQLDALLDNPDFLKLGMGMMTGALGFCKRKLAVITPNAGFTEDDRAWFLAKINEFLGAP